MTNDFKKNVNEFWAQQSNLDNKLLATRLKKDDRLDYDLKLIQKFISKHTRVLDLAAGTGIISEAVSPLVHSVTAVDKYSEFLNECPTYENITLIQSDILYFKSENKYDLILVFGLMNYFDAKESDIIYGICSNLLENDGTLIIKHQCGLVEDVLIDSYSEELKKNYTSLYKSVENEKKLLSKYFNVIDIVDIYPEKLNRWDNTHFYAFICKGKNE